MKHIRRSFNALQISKNLNSKQQSLNDQGMINGKRNSFVGGGVDVCVHARTKLFAEVERWFSGENANCSSIRS